MYSSPEVGDQPLTVHVYVYVYLCVYVYVYVVVHAEDTPIMTTIRCHGQDGETLEVRCDDYAVREAGADDDAFLAELRAFLASVTSGRVPHPLSAYLDGIEVALEIRARILGSEPRG